MINFFKCCKDTVSYTFEKHTPEFLTVVMGALGGMHALGGYTYLSYVDEVRAADQLACATQTITCAFLCATTGFVLGKIYQAAKKGTEQESLVGRNIL